MRIAKNVLEMDILMFPVTFVEEMVCTVKFVKVVLAKVPLNVLIVRVVVGIPVGNVHLVL